MPNFFQPMQATPQIAPILALNLLIMMGNGLIGPALPLYAQSFGINPALAGLVITMFGVGRLIANLPAGVLSQRFGRKLLFCIGSMILGIGCVGAALAGSFSELVVFRFIQGIGAGIYMTTGTAALSDIAALGDRGRVMALQQSAILVGTSLGPAMGGLLAANAGYAAPFWGYAAVAAVALLISLTTRSLPMGGGIVGDEQSQLNNSLTSIDFIIGCMMNCLLFFTRGATLLFLIPLISHDKYGLDVGMIGISMTILALCNSLTLPWTGKLLERWGAQNIVVATTLLQCLGLLVLAAGTTHLWYWPAIVLVGIGTGVNSPAMAAHFVSIVPQRLFGVSAGLQRSAGDAGLIAGPALVGLLGQMLSLSQSGSVVAVTMLLLAGTLTFALVRTRTGTHLSGR